VIRLSLAPRVETTSRRRKEQGKDQCNDIDMFRGVSSKTAIKGGGILFFGCDGGCGTANLQIVCVLQRGIPSTLCNIPLKYRKLHTKPNYKSQIQKHRDGGLQVLTDSGYVALLRYRCITLPLEIQLLALCSFIPA
jgi:hypothetical protein